MSKTVIIRLAARKLLGDPVVRSDVNSMTRGRSAAELREHAVNRRKGAAECLRRSRSFRKSSMSAGAWLGDAIRNAAYAAALNAAAGERERSPHRFANA